MSSAKPGQGLHCTSHTRTGPTPRSRPYHPHLAPRARTGALGPCAAWAQPCMLGLEPQDPVPPPCARIRAPRTHNASAGLWMPVLGPTCSHLALYADIGAPRACAASAQHHTWRQNSGGPVPPLPSLAHRIGATLPYAPNLAHDHTLKALHRPMRSPAGQMTKPQEPDLILRPVAENADVNRGNLFT